MNSKVPKWMPPEPAVCFPNQSEEASQNEAAEEEEAERCKRPRRTMDSEEGVEEFLVLLERIEETKKHLKRKHTNLSGSSISAGGEEDEMLMALPLMQQPQVSSDAVDTIAYNKSATLPWKPSFQWEDFHISNSMSAQPDLIAAAATEKNKDEEGSIQIGNGLSKTRSFLDRLTPAECSHDHVDDVKKKKDDVDGAPKLELQLFPI